MARNRKRRGDSRRTDEQPTRPGVATARPQREPRARPDEAPEPMQHASPDADIVEAQLAAAEAEAERPEGSAPQAGEPDGGPVAGPDVANGGPVAEVNRLDDDSELDDEDVDRDELLDDDGSAGGGLDGPRRRGGGGGGDDSGGGGPGSVPEASPASAPRRRNGIVAFAQGSWRELQRVQWPDRRQVIQATGVVIGFVIVAGAYLGVADWVATKIVHFILS